ncbi:MAG: GIY-YIG nuclease family protein [Deltaproteobacteria bacterium]|nr:GIY-YIG nuclease family protein [Deltaproteobacteria bacterium]
MSKYYTYIIYSERLDKFYTGSTTSLKWRLERHNQGWSRSTKGGIPWKVVYSETFSNKPDAILRELYIKKRKSREFIKRLISQRENQLIHCEG